MSEMEKDSEYGEGSTSAETAIEAERLMQALETGTPSEDGEFPVSQGEKKKSRRKSCHQVVKADEDISFESIGAVHAGGKREESHDERLMRRVAFLRASVNYLMLHLGFSEFVYPPEVTSSWLEEEFLKKQKERDLLQSQSHKPS